MKIVVATHYFSTHGGGIERVCDWLTSLMSERLDWSVEWHASDCDLAAPDVPRRRLVSAASSNFIEEQIGLPYPFWSPAAYLNLWRAVKGCDLVHVHDYIYLSSIVALASAIVHQKPRVLTQHIGFIPYESRIKRVALSVLNRTLGRVCIGGFSRVCFVSDHVRDYFGRFTKLEHASVVANGVDTSVFHPLPQQHRRDARATLGLPPDSFVVLFVGRFTEKKGLHILRDVVSKLPHIRFVFAGSGPLDPTQWQLPNVRVFYDQPPRALSLLYQTADLLVLPSKGEGFPLVVQESMACGTPAAVSPEVANALPGVAEYVHAVGVSTTSASQNWIKLVQDLFENTCRRKDRELVSAFAQSSWSWRGCAGAYEAIYQELAAAEDRRPGSACTKDKS